MTEQPVGIAENPQPQFDPQKYINKVRALYHSGDAEPRGQRNPEQREIAGLLSMEADELFDGIKNFAVYLTGGPTSEEHPIPEDEDIKWGELTYKDYRSAFRQMYVGLGVMTNRVARENESFREKYHEMMQLPDADRISLMGYLFSDFQQLNAYRFGVDGMGAPRRRTIKDYPDDGGAPVDKVIIGGDKDVYSDNGQEVVASRRKYTSETPGTTVLHAAAKISPEEVVRLRLEFPEVDADQFFNVVWGNRNPEEILSNIK
jgi:hypothetical protein